MSIEQNQNPFQVTIRRACDEDAQTVAELMTVLGYPSSSSSIAKRIRSCSDSSDTAVFIAESRDRVVGIISFHCIPQFHADGFLGRITSLVVSPEDRQRGVGRLLVTAAEEFGWAHGCIRAEVTSGDHRPEAHAFYEHLGYKLESRRFIKHDPDA
jgi:GNAT superfamily N-acetyltransferase